MLIAFIISVGYSALGLIYEPGINSTTAFTFIFLSCLPFILAEAVAPIQLKKSDAPLSTSLYITLFALGLANIAIVAHSAGSNPRELLSIEGALQVAVKSTRLRYSEADNSGNPLLMALSLYFLYKNGLSINSQSKYKTYLSFIPLILYSIVSTEKYPLFVGISFFLASILATQNKLQLTFKTITHSLLSIIGISVASVIAVFTRGGAVESAAGTLFFYVLAPYPAFGDWLISTSLEPKYGLGSYTFIGPLDALSIAKREAGVFQDFYLTHGKLTNIKTAWKYLVKDFSIIGPLAFTSFVSVFYVYLVKLKQYSAATCLRFIAILFSILSLNTTPFVHNSVAFALALSSLDLFLHNLPKSLSLKITNDKNRTHYL